MPPRVGDERLDPPLSTRQIHRGAIVNLRVSDYRRPDGVVVTREVMDHPGAAVVVPVDGDRVLLVRQPREAVERRTLELPAGKLDSPGEDPLECARRELAEEVGRAASHWESWGGFYTVPAILTEYMHCFYATGLSVVEGISPDADEDIEVVAWPLSDLDALIQRVEDAKTLIGLMHLRHRLG